MSNKRSWREQYIIGGGKYRLKQQYQHLQVTESKWFLMCCVNMVKSKIVTQQISLTTFIVIASLRSQCFVQC